MVYGLEPSSNTREATDKSKTVVWFRSRQSHCLSFWSKSQSFPAKRQYIVMNIPAEQTPLDRSPRPRFSKTNAGLLRQHDPALSWLCRAKNAKPGPLDDTQPKQTLTFKISIKFCT